METVLSLFKIDIGVTHTLRDASFTAHITATKAEIERKGILLNLNSVEDQVLLSDYAAWTYRKRTENIGISENLKARIRGRIIKERSTYVED